MKVSIRHMIALLAIAMLITSCGAMSAPPVELPAPVTGRISVSEPDASGNVNITGTAGAVPAGSTVMAVNEEVAGTVAWKILNALIKPAYADDEFPDICSEAGYSCTNADSAGAFLIIIPAETGVPIVIGIIDPLTGEFISEVIRRYAGDGWGDSEEGGGGGEDVNCAAEGVQGNAVDIAVVPGEGTPIVLRQGSDTNTNQLAIGTSPAVDVSLDGCYAHSIAVTKTSTGEVILAVTSKDDKKLWTAKLNGTSVENAQSFTLDANPIHVKFADSSSDPVVSLQTSDSVKLARISLSDGSITQETQITSTDYNQTSLTPIPGLVQSTSLDIMKMEDSAHHYLGSLIVNKGNAEEPYLCLFAADELATLDTFYLPTMLQEYGEYGPIEAKFFITYSGIVSIITLDPNKNVMIPLTPGYYDSVSHDNNVDPTKGALTTLIPLFVDTDITSSTIVAWGFTPATPVSTIDSFQTVANVVKFTLVQKEPPDTNASPYQNADHVVGATDDGKLWVSAIDTMIDIPGTIHAIVDGHPFVAIDSCSSTETIFMADGTTKEAISGSSVIW